MKHRREIVEEAIRESGIPITTIAKRLGKTRQWLYLLFDNQIFPLDSVIAIGRIIYHNFSDEIDFSIITTQLQELHIKLLPKKDSVEYWKEKYY